MNRIFSTLVALISLTSLIAGEQTTPPKLVVGITIDQLRGDYLELFKDTFGEGGFNRLFNKGLVYSDIKFDFPYIDRASAITTIYTGANPAYHGIVSNEKFILKDNQTVSSFSDNYYSGVFTKECLSPLTVRVSTITDELKIASNGQSDIFAFAPHASQALASGGHAATGAYWIDDLTGRWATSSFYKTQRYVVEQYNRTNESFSRSIGQLSWRPEMDISKYTAFPYTRNLYNFQHQFHKNKKFSYELLKQSPFMNSEVWKMAEKIIDSESLGQRKYPDFLALTMYAGHYDNALDKNYSVEIQDLYHRLDKELEHILNRLDDLVGLNNILVFVTSTGYFDEQEILPKDYVSPGGDFYPERSSSLLNMYLMALYGREQWVSKFYNNQIFLNRKLIEDKKIDFVEMQQKSAEFLVQSAGIQDVITSHQMLHGAYNQNVQFHRNSYYKGVSGDLFLELQPGWRIKYENETEDNNYRVRSNAVSAPVFFFGHNVKPQRINRTIDAIEIAPSVTHRLRIRAPNAAKGSILKELF